MGLKPDKKIRWSDLRKTWGGVFDNQTILAIYKLMNRGDIKEVVGVVKEGKESKVLAARGRKGTVAIKVYAIEAANFKRMLPYLIGDPRFGRIKKDKRSIIFAWAKKEFKNLERARKAGVHCPRPIAFEKNVLVLEFIGDDFKPAQRLSHTRPKDPEKVFKVVIGDMKRMWVKAGIVHGDLSEFNILLHKERPWIIDFSQSVVKDHPHALGFLKRDINNVCIYFRKLGVECEDEEIYEKLLKR
ncbi:MAG: serine protein kinase RIO [Candidatus Aenigmatarchaeota archaeon]